VVTKLSYFLLVLLIVLLPSQLSFHFWPAWSSISGLRIDYLSPTIFVTDLLMLAVVLINIHKLYLMYRLPTALEKLILVFVVLNIIFSSIPLFSLYKYLKLLLYISFFVYLKNQKKIHLASLLEKYFPLTLLWIALLALAQFLLKKSLGGPLWILGERPLSLDMPLVAKVSLNNLGLFLRPYATLPHPNALAGFLTLGVLIQLKYFPLKKNTQLSTALSVIAALLAQSAGTIVALIISSLFAYFKKIKVRLIVLSILTLSLLVVAVHKPAATVTDRLHLLNKGFSEIAKHPIFGVGLGSFPVTSANTNTASLLDHQPVHNLPVLLASEIGIPLFLLLVVYLLPKITSDPLLVFVFTSSLFDHYWLTSHQNFLLLGFYILITKLKSPTHE